MTGIAPGKPARTRHETTDRLGSTVALANGSAEVATAYSYEPFGASTETGAASDNPYQFTGRENDGTGLQYNRARYYSFGAGRFISQDPAGFEGGGANLYWYVGGNPIDLTDPTGECFLVCLPNPLAPFEDAADQVGDWVSEAPGVLSEFGSFLQLGKCGTSFGQRVVNNIVTTNKTVPGLVAPTLSGAVVNRYGGIAAGYGTQSAISWLFRSRNLTELPLVARAAGVSWIYASASWELGAGVGSVLRSGMSELYCAF